MRKQRHDFARHHTDASIERPHSPEFAKVGDPGSLDVLPARSLCAKRQQGVSSDALYYGHCRDVDLVHCKVLTKPDSDLWFL